MLDTAMLESVAAQLMTAKQIELQGKTWPVIRTSSQRLRTARFALNGREYQAIEQNRHKPSRWGELAREGHQVVQFRDIQTGKYVAVAVDGKVQQYGKPLTPSSRRPHWASKWPVHRVELTSHRSH
ncbi:MAG TPA: hypothetical protein VMT28_17395 [Terriglobales bacterium]|jgi:hypothetical protein|nr:hypothetical protein [Terriglobales bacterium]